MMERWWTGLKVVEVNEEYNTMTRNEVDADEKHDSMEMDDMKHASGDHEPINSPRLEMQSSFTDKRVQEEFDWVAKLLKPYSTFVVKYPSAIIIMTIVIIVLSVVLAIVESAGGKGIPNFSDPLKGYEPRGTVLSQKTVVRNHLHDAFYNGQLSYRRHTQRSRRSISVHNLDDNMDNIHDRFEIMYEHSNGDNLFDHMDDLCLWYKSKITTQADYSTHISHVHHIPNYIALLNKRGNCDNITSSDVQQFVSLLEDCVVYYKNNSLHECMANHNCSTIPDRCRFHVNIPNEIHMTTLLYNVFHYLGDSKLKDNPRFLKLTASVSYVELYNNAFFYSVYKKVLVNLDDTKYQGIKVVAYKIKDLKPNVFSKELISQAALLMIAVCIVILLGWLFSGSLFLGLMTLNCIIAAMCISFFVYNRIFNLPFFPFLNITTLIFIIGIGADDVFVYTCEWELAKEIYKIYDTCLSDTYMIKWTTHTLRHSGVSMFVTSITTAAAFYANISSSITALKCFGLFSGTAIMVNYILMITLFPCCVIIHEKYFSRCMHFLLPSVCKLPPVYSQKTLDQIDNNVKETSRISRASYSFFIKYLPRIIHFMRYPFVIIFFILGVVGIIVAFVKPGLSPPSIKTVQMFDSGTSIEQYDLFIKKKFDSGLEKKRQLYIDFVFGVELDDNGDSFNPDDKGSLVLKEGELKIASNQIWLKQFCKNIKSAFFYVSSASCDSIGNFFDVLTGRCVDPLLKPCCNRQLPLENKEFMACFDKIIQGRKKNYLYQPLYSKNGVLKTFLINVKTIFVFSPDNKRHVEHVDTWTSLQMRNASSSMKGWWMVAGTSRFLDLQDGLATGMRTSFGIALVVAFVVILLVSLNVFLSLFSVVTLMFILSITVSILIGDGWKLSVVESTVFSVGAGLSADFTMHYSIAYKSSLFKDDRKRRTEDALSHIGPATFMGALTTFVGGMVMYPSTVLAYRQIGTFLMVIMFVSWLYSNFFFLPLCSIIGPTDNFGQIRCHRKEKKSKQPEQSALLDDDEDE